jgi:hypothetical protein
MPGAIFGKPRIWSASVVGVLSLALVVQGTAQSAGAAATGVEFSDDGEVVEILPTGDGINLVAVQQDAPGDEPSPTPPNVVVGENDEVVEIDSDALDINLVIDQVALDRPPPARAVTDQELNELFDTLNGHMAEFGWDMTNEDHRAQVRQEFEDMRAALAPIDTDNAIGERTQTNLTELRQALDTVENSSTCEGRCLAGFGERARRIVITATISSAASLGLTLAGQMQIPAGAVFIVTPVAVALTEIYFSFRDHLQAVRDVELRQHANNALFAAVDVVVQNRIAAGNARADLGAGMVELAQDVEAANGGSSAPPAEETTPIDLVHDEL